MKASILFFLHRKACPDCLTRKNRAGETEYFHRSVVCMTVGKAPHVILGQEMLKPGDGPEKDEGELPGGKRLIGRLRQRHGHFADVIVADALYLNAPFINTIKENGLEAVIRLKDKKRLIFQMQRGFLTGGKEKRKHSSMKKRRSRYGIFTSLRLKTAHIDSGWCDTMKAGRRAKKKQRDGCGW